MGKKEVEIRIEDHRGQEKRDHLVCDRLFFHILSHVIFAIIFQSRKYNMHFRHKGGEAWRGKMTPRGHGARMLGFEPRSVQLDHMLFAQSHGVAGEGWPVLALGTSLSSLLGTK